MSDEIHNYGGLRLKNDGDKSDNNSSGTGNNTKENNKRFEYTPFEGENFNLDNNVYFDSNVPVRDSTPSTSKGFSFFYNGRLNWWFILYAALTVGFFVWQLNLFQKSNAEKRLINTGVSQEALITDVERHYRRRGTSTSTIYVSYEANGMEYHNKKLGKSGLSYYKGEYITIYYEPNRPSVITSKVTANYTKSTIFVNWFLIAICGFLSFKAYVDPDSITKMSRGSRSGWRRFGRW